MKTTLALLVLFGCVSGPPHVPDGPGAVDAGQLKRADKTGAVISRCGLWTFTMGIERLQPSEDLVLTHMAPIYGPLDRVCEAFEDVFVEKVEDPNAPFFVQAFPGKWAWVGGFTEFNPSVAIHLNGQPAWNDPFGHELAHVLDWRLRGVVYEHHDDWGPVESGGLGIDDATYAIQYAEFARAHGGMTPLEWMDFEARHAGADGGQ